MMCDSCSEAEHTTRRSFLLLGAGVLLAGCSQPKGASSLPGPVWKPRVKPITVPDGPTPSSSTVIEGVLPRAHWARGQPVPPLMKRMLPVRYITVHHDGMNPFSAADPGSSAARLEAIRRSHRMRGWGDIGYHFAIDRSGRVWEGRLLMWQGAHVKDRNEGNIGVVALGNFDRQAPTPQQLEALNNHVSSLMQRYRVPTQNVFTHQEWPGAVTACPGVNLQRYMVAIRQNRQLG